MKFTDRELRLVLHFKEFYTWAYIAKVMHVEVRDLVLSFRRELKNITENCGGAIP